MKEFKEAHGHLPVSELAGEMKVFITMKKGMKVSSSTGSKGKGKPLSVLQHEGYNAEQLANIGKAADKEWDAILGSFVDFVDIQHRGNMEEQCAAKESVVAGSPAKDRQRQLKKTLTESLEPSPKKQKKEKQDSSSEDKGDEKLEGDAKEKGKNKKKKASNNSRRSMRRLSVASQVAKQRKDAKVIVGSIAPVLAQLTNISQKAILSVTA